jgi:hypothetical protein
MPATALRLCSIATSRIARASTLETYTANKASVRLSLVFISQKGDEFKLHKTIAAAKAYVEKQLRQGHEARFQARVRRAIDNLNRIENMDLKGRE